MRYTILHLYWDYGTIGNYWRPCAVGVSIDTDLLILQLPCRAVVSDTWKILQYDVVKYLSLGIARVFACCLLVYMYVYVFADPDIKIER